MTYNEALQFFAEHGGVSSDTERLDSSQPSERQMQSACDHAINVKHQPKALVEQAKQAIMEYYK